MRLCTNVPQWHLSGGLRRDPAMALVQQTSNARAVPAAAGDHAPVRLIRTANTKPHPARIE